MAAARGEERLQLLAEQIRSGVESNPGKTLQYLDEAMETVTKFPGAGERRLWLLLHYCRAYLNLGEPGNALDYAEKLLASAGDRGSQLGLRDAYQILSHVYSRLNNAPMALEYYKKYKATDDSIRAEEDRQKMALLTLKYESNQKKYEISLLKRAIKLRQFDLDARRGQKNKLVGLAAGFVMFLILIYSRYRLKVRFSHALQKEAKKHRATTAKLMESEAKVRTLSEQALIGIFVFQRNALQYMNPTFLKVTGYSEKELLGRSPLDFMAEEDRSRMRLMLHRLIRGEIEFMHARFRGLTGGGEMTWAETYCTCFHLGGRTVILGTLMDISEREKVRAELMKGRQLEAVGILAGGLAHDFNNLLSIIIGKITLAKYRANRDGVAHHYLERAEEAVDEAAALVNKLLTFTEAGWMFPKRIELPGAWNSILRASQGLKGRVSGDLLFSEPEPVFADEHQLKLVLRHLAAPGGKGINGRGNGNANNNGNDSDDDSDDDKGSGEADVGAVSIRAENITLPAGNKHSLEAGKYVKIYLANSGFQLPEDMNPDGSEGFLFAGNPGAWKSPGLELAICLSIMEKHSGHMTWSRGSGDGTVFELLLPVYEPELKGL